MRFRRAVECALQKLLAKAVPTEKHRYHHPFFDANDKASYFWKTDSPIQSSLIYSQTPLKSPKPSISSSRGSSRTPSSGCCGTRTTKGLRTVPPRLRYLECMTNRVHTNARTLPTPNAPPSHVHRLIETQHAVTSQVPVHTIGSSLSARVGNGWFRLVASVLGGVGNVGDEDEAGGLD